MKNNLTTELANYCVAARDRELPNDVLVRARWVALDEIGCMILGSTMLPGQLVREHVLALGGHGESTVVGSDQLAPMPLAALANGTANHADELDGTHVSEGHPGAMIVPTCVAVAENERNSGASLLQALALGFDVGTRIKDALRGRVTMLNKRHIHSGIAYTFGVAAAAGSLLQLDAEQFRYAFAISLHMVNKPAAFFEERDHMTKALNCGQAAYAGISGAMMARRGMTATPDIVGSEHGALAMWTDDPDYDRVIENLGSEYTILGANFKLYSAGYPIHSPIAACLRALDGRSISVHDIDHIDVYITTSGAQAVDDRDMPSICLQDMLSVAILSGGLDFDTAHNPDILRRRDVQELRRKVSVHASPELDAEDARGRGCRVTLTLEDGRQIHESQAAPPGHSSLGDMTWETITEKFMSISEPRIGLERSVAIVDSVASLHLASDLTVLSGSLRG